jgi:hypothetical protein
MRIRTLLLAACVCALAAVASPAYADVGISAFSVTPSPTQAGIPSSGSGPNFDVDVKFWSTNWDSANRMTLSLAPGMLANPEAPTQCSGWQFQFNWCPGSSKIGEGWTTATAPGAFGFTDAFKTSVYLVQPQGAEPARIGLIIDFWGFPVESATAPVYLRTKEGDVGLDFDFSGLPNLWNGISVVIDEVHLTIWGQVNGKVFTRNPTSCQPTASRVAVVSYGNPGATATASSPFTATGCQNLGYSPQLLAAAQPDTSDAGVAYGVQVNQGVFDAATKGITLTTPASLSPNLTTLNSACAASDVSTCPAIGWASASTPVLPNPISGKVVLIAHPGSLPSAAILFNSPFATRIDSTSTISSSPLALQTTFDNLPDVPLTSLTVVFYGGPGSLFLSGTHLCSSPQTTTAQFSAWSGATAQQSATTQILSCPVATTASAAAHRLAALVRAHERRPTVRSRRARRARRALRHRRASHARRSTRRHA